MNFQRSSLRRYINRLQLLHLLQFSRRYWTLLQHWKIIVFSLNKKLFAITKWATHKKESISILGKFIKSVFNQFIFVLILIMILESLDNFRLAQGWTIDRVVPININIDSQSYLNSLRTLAQLAGVFLGLYFTAVNVVASTIYSKVSGDIRGLFIRETGDSFYLRIVLTFLIAYVVSTAVSTLGYQLGNLNLIFIIILGFLVILGFFKFGIKSFDLFDPARFAPILISDIWEMIQAVSPKGFKWREPSFQEFNQRQAETELKTYYNVVRMAGSDDNLQLESLKHLGVRALNLLQIYALIKPFIPSESFWYKRTFQHQDWLASRFDAIDIAMRTGTTIRPKMKPDLMWFESYIEKIVIGSLKNLIDRKDYKNAYELEDGIWRTLDVLAYNLSIDEALYLFNAMKENVFIQAHNTNIESTNLSKDQDDFRLILGLVDLYGLALISIVLGLSRRIMLMSPESFGKCIAEMQWNRSDSIYENALPRPVIQIMEKIQKGIQFEIAVEGKIISPVWYQQQLAAQGLIIFFTKSIEKVTQELESSFIGEVELLIREGKFIIAAQLIQRGLEACSKFVSNFGEAKIFIEEFDIFQKIKDIQYAMPEWEKLNARVDLVRESLVIAFATSLNSLARVEPSANIPDYFGQGILLVAKECYDSMKSGNEKKFSAIFPAFFSACLSARDREFAQLEYQDKNMRFIISNEPILDLFAISGCAIIYSELDSKNYWSFAKSLWDKYYASYKEGPVAVSKYFKATFEYSISMYAMLTLLYQHTPLRLEWKRDLELNMQNRGLMKDRNTYYLREERSKEPKHTSAIIQALEKFYEIYSLEEIFLGLYIMKRPEAKEIDWNRYRLAHIAKSFADEERGEEIINGEIPDETEGKAL